MKYRLIILLLVIGSLGNNLMAIVWDGTSKTIWTQGKGTKNAPYLIETPAQLAYLSAQVAAGKNYNGVCFLQTTDLDINSKSWNQIGGSSTPFAGKYDGGKHQILNIKNPVFGYVQSATISNLTVAGASTYPLIYETSGNTTVVNCNNKSTAEVNFAGLIRKSTKVLHISNCSNYARITQSVVETKISHHVQDNDSRCAAGIVAVVDSLYATNCYNRGAVSINAKNTSRCTIYTGGIVGYVLQGAIIGKCFNRSSIGCSGGYEVGYVCAGICSGGSHSIIDLCYNIGNLSGTGSGIAFDATVTNCYSKGTLVSLSSYNSYGITDGTSHNCYFAGSTVQMVTGAGGNTYYLETCSAQKETVARPKSEGEMKSQSFLDLLNADGEYFCKDYTNSNGGFPVLRWQLGKFYPIRGLCKSEQGTITGAGDYPKGAEIQLTATPKDNFVFAGWSDGITANPRTIKVEGEATYVAQFERTSYTVYVNQDCSITVE